MTDIDDETSLMLPPERKPPSIPSSNLKLPDVPQGPDPLALSLEPRRAWFTQLGGVSKHIICNHSSDRLALKVRCSNNKAFRVNPVYMFLDGNEKSRDFEIYRLQGGDIKKDRLQILFTIARDGDTDPVQLFGKKARVRSILIPLITI